MKKTIFTALALVLTILAASCGEGPRDPAALAAEWDASVASISGATLENEREIDDACLAYYSLPEEAREKTTGFGTLQALRSELKKEYIVKEYRDSRIPHDRLLIGCYRIPECSDAVLSALSECRFDLVWDSVDSDMLKKYGLGMIPSAYALNVPALGDEETFLSDVRKMGLDRETIWCLDLQDEPRLIDMEYLHGIGVLLGREALPGSAFLSNLLPTYAFRDRAEDYREYVGTYFDTIGRDSDLVSFDHYLYNGERGSGANQLSSFLNNLEIVAQYCRENGHDMNVILQHIDVSERGLFEVTVPQLKFQAYASLAYGAKGVHWYAMHKYEFSIVDENGEKTALFDRLGEVNRDLKALEPVYMRYTGDGTAVLLNSTFAKNMLGDAYLGSFDAEGTGRALKDLKPGADGSLIVGHFRKNVGDGEAYLFVGCRNYNFKAKQTSSVTFSAASPDAVITAYVRGIPTRLVPDENGVFTVEVKNADAVFVTVE
ncbi:MAG: hypothetical protein IJU75_05355 [Clostridia bacterium]|nr:hypothetical protein [Clostridia bacterium]